MLAKNLREWHKLVCERDKYICSVCYKDFDYPTYWQNGVNQYLCGDHILTQGSHPELRLEVDNGRATCLPCHNKRHQKGFNN